MEFNAFRKRFLEIITQEYLKKYRSKTLSIINPTDYTALQAQIMEVTCGGSSCTKCMELYMDLRPAVGQGQENKLKLIDNLRNTTCRPLCVCDISANMTMDSSLISNSNSNIAFDDNDLSEITAGIMKEIGQTDYKIDETSVKDLVQDSGIITTINTQISQSSANIQLIKFKGSGKISRTTMSMASKIVMNAIISNKENENQINEIVFDSVKQIREFVDNKFDNLFTRIWKENELFFICMLSIIFISFCFVIIMKVNKILK